MENSSLNPELQPNGHEEEKLVLGIFYSFVVATWNSNVTISADILKFLNNVLAFFLLPLIYVSSPSSEPVTVFIGAAINSC